MAANVLKTQSCCEQLASAFRREFNSYEPSCKQNFNIFRGKPWLFKFQLTSFGGADKEELHAEVN